VLISALAIVCLTVFVGLLFWLAERPLKRRSTGRTVESRGSNERRPARRAS
jgi:hypothetical protein